MGGEEGLMRRLVTESSDAGFATRTRGFDSKCESMNDEKLAGEVVSRTLALRQYMLTFLLFSAWKMNPAAVPTEGKVAHLH